MDFTRSELEQLGFEGFLNVDRLKGWHGCNAIPEEMGVYAVCRDRSDCPEFVFRSGGYSIEKLMMNWIDGAYVLNIGKAGGSECKTGLRKRIGAYIRFGKRGKGGHRGGRAIWQLSDVDEFLVAWRVLTDIEPIKEEQRLIDEFKAHYGRYPFANMRR